MVIYQKQKVVPILVGVFMENILYFSDIVDLKENLEKNGNILCYIAPCGTGKTHFIMDKNEGLASKGKVLCMTSRKAKVDEDEASEKNDFENNFKSDNCEVTNLKLLYKIKSLMEYGHNTDKIDEFIEKFDYIVVDEVHALACDSLFQNNLVTIISFLKYAALVHSKPIIVLSATVKPAQRFLLNELSDGDRKIKPIDSSDVCPGKIPNIIASYTKEKALNSISSIIARGEKFIYFANTYDELQELFNNIVKLGVDQKQIVVAMSSKNQNKFYKNNPIYSTLKTDVLKAREYLAKKSELPSNVRVLLATSTYKEGIGIKNQDIDYVFCESHYVPDIIQFMGRVRKPAKGFFVISDSVPIFSNIDDMDYNFCNSDDFRKACKKHLSTLKYERGVIDEKEKFIEFLNSKFRYIAYDFFNNNFVVDELRYNMQKDLIESSENYAWESELRDFVGKYPQSLFCNISALNRDSVKEKALREIHSILKIPQLGDDATKHVYDLFSIAYGTKSRQKTKFKGEIKPLGYVMEDVNKKIDRKHIRGIKITLDRGDEFFEELFAWLDQCCGENKNFNNEIVMNKDDFE